MTGLNKEKQQQLIGVIVAGVAVVACLYWFVIRSQNASIQGIRNSTEATAAGVQKARELLDKSKATKDTLDKAQASLDELEGGMASGDLYFWVINFMNKFVAGHKVELASYSREEFVHVGLFPEFPYSAVKYNIRGSAYYHDLGKYLAEFENSNPFMRFQSLELSPSEGEKVGFRMDLIALLKPVPTVKNTGK